MTGPQGERRKLGQRGEALAADYLRGQGLTILAANWRPSNFPELRGELDLIAQDGATLVFVEVRTRRGAAGLAEESVGPAKQAQLAQLALAYLSTLPDGDRLDWRIDVVAISLTPQGTWLNWIRSAL